MAARLLLLSLLFATAPAAARAAEPITICADPEPPPWNFWKRDKNGEPTRELVGFSVDLMRKLFKRQGREVRFITGRPWARCLYDVRKHEVGFAMDIYKDGIRAPLYLFSLPYNTLTPQLFTLRDHPIQVDSPEDLKRYKGCGIYGASYAHYGLRDQDLDLSANGYVGVIAKLKNHYCDYFVEELEILAGYRLMNEDFLDDAELAHRPLKGAASPSLHLITAKDGPDAALMPGIDDAIESMDKSGELAALWRKYAGDIPYNR